MTPFDQAVSVVHVAINALILLLFWHVPWRRSCQERYRQKLFGLRDELFDLARYGGISFTEPAYIALRARINSMIRFSHTIGVTRLATFIIFKRYIGDLPKLYPSFESAVAEVKGQNTKQTLMKIENTLRKHTVRHLLFASPQVLIAGPALYLLDQFMSKKKAAPKYVPRRNEFPRAVFLIELQARDAYRSEAVKRRHTQELASAI